MFKLWFPLGVCEFCSPWWVSEFDSSRGLRSFLCPTLASCWSIHLTQKMHLFLFPCAGSPFQLDLNNPVVFYFHPQNVVRLLRCSIATLETQQAKAPVSNLSGIAPVSRWSFTARSRESNSALFFSFSFSNLFPYLHWKFTLALPMSHHDSHVGWKWCFCNSM